MHPKEVNLSMLLSRIPKGAQIVSCRIEQADEFEDHFELIADTPNIVSLVYRYKSYDIDFDFSAIRNKMDEMASGEWCLHIDSDEYIGNRPEDVIDELHAMNEVGAVAGWISISGLMYKNSNEIAPRERYAIHSCRLIKRNSGITWEGIVHEIPTTHGKELPFVDTDIFLLHDGYKIETDDFQKKAERNGTLLIREYTRQPTKRCWNYLIKTFTNLKLKE